GVDVGLDLVRRRRPLRLQLVTAPPTLALVVQDHEEHAVEQICGPLGDVDVAELQPLLYCETASSSVSPQEHLLQTRMDTCTDEGGPTVTTGVDRRHPHEGQSKSPIARRTHLAGPHSDLSRPVV